MNEMNDILAIVNKREEELIRAIEKAKKDEATFPDGRLRINNNAGQTRYYKMTKRGDTTGEYLSVKNMDTIRLLAQKDYSRKFLKKAKAELKALHLIRKQLTKECTEASYENLSIERQELVKPYILSDIQYAECWQSIKFKPNPYEPEKKIYDTRKGDKVRSKSEAIIADMLYEMKIPYFYEFPVKLKNGKVKYPDFTILKKSTREVIYLEHFGYLDDEKYRIKALKKMDEYRASGIYPGKNLLLTYETEKVTLDIKGIKKMLKDVL